MSEKEKYERACGGSAVLSSHPGITSLLLDYATPFLLAELYGSHELRFDRVSRLGILRRVCTDMYSYYICGSRRTLGRAPGNDECTLDYQGEVTDIEQTNSASRSIQQAFHSVNNVYNEEWLLWNTPLRTPLQIHTSNERYSPLGESSKHIIRTTGHGLGHTEPN